MENIDSDRKADICRILVESSVECLGLHHLEIETSGDGDELMQEQHNESAEVGVDDVEQLAEEIGQEDMEQDCTNSTTTMITTDDLTAQAVHEMNTGIRITPS